MPMVRVSNGGTGEIIYDRSHDWGNDTYFNDSITITGLTPGEYYLASPDGGRANSLTITNGTETFNGTVGQGALSSCFFFKAQTDRITITTSWGRAHIVHVYIPS